jgi:hypothetical protein
MRPHPASRTRRAPRAHLAARRAPARRIAKAESSRGNCSARAVAVGGSGTGVPTNRVFSRKGARLRSSCLIGHAFRPSRPHLARATRVTRAKCGLEDAPSRCLDAGAYNTGGAGWPIRDVIQCHFLSWIIAPSPLPPGRTANPANQQYSAIISSIVRVVSPVFGAPTRHMFVSACPRAHRVWASALVALLCANAAVSSAHDSVNWQRSHVGRVTDASLAGQRQYVATAQGVVACLTLRTGEVGTRLPRRGSARDFGAACAACAA